MKANILFAGAPDHELLDITQIFLDAVIEAGYRAACLTSQYQDHLFQCLVGISQGEAIPSPYEPPEVALLANQTAVDHLEYAVKTNGLLILNARAMQRPIHRHDLDVIQVPTASTDTPICESMILLGALIALTEWITPQQMRESIRQSCKDEHLCRALDQGVQFIHTFANAA